MAIFKITHENRAVFDGEKFNRGIRSEYDYSEEQVFKLLPEMIHHFRCKDDDGVTYFWGMSSDANSFAPLDMVGAEYGCTSIEYKNEETGKYQAL